MEDNNVAIQFIKFDLGYGIYAFKPVGIIKGIYDKEMETFQTNYGNLYSSIKYSNDEVEGYFFAPRTIEELKERYPDIDEENLLSVFYEDLTNYIYLGVEYEYEIGIAAISIDSLANYFDGEENINEDKESDYYLVSEEGLMELMSLDSLKEIRKKLSELINSNVDAKKGSSEDEKQEDKKEKKIKDGEYAPKHMTIEKSESKKLTLAELKEEVLNNIIGQDQAVNSVVTTIIVNENSKNPKHRSHILIAGPSGTGKTEMMNVISKRLGKPVFKADSTAYTVEGYVGKSVYSMLKGLIGVSNGDLEKAQNGILIIDEIDKKVSEKKDDVNGTAVINSLLKIMDRDIIEVDTAREETVSFDTSNLTIVFMGAFSDLYEKKQKDKEEKEKKKKEEAEDKKITIGFTAVHEEKKEEDKKESKDKAITKQDLIDYGVPPEFLGRISKIAYTKELTEEDLIQILKKSKISPLKMEEEFFKDLGITFKYTNGYIMQLAQNCLKHKTGARELKSEVQKSLENVYEEVLNNPGKIKTLKLTKKTALDNKKYEAN